MSETITTTSREETWRLARDLALQLKKLPLTRAAVITLQGDLGAGKTTFTQGFLAALGYTDTVTSPTFVLMQRYPLDGEPFTNAYHLDAYRLTTPEDFAVFAFDEPLTNPTNIFLIEWPEVARTLITPVLALHFAHGATVDTRTITYQWLS